MDETRPVNFYTYSYPGQENIALVVTVLTNSSGKRQQINPSSRTNYVEIERKAALYTMHITINVNAFGQNASSY